MRKVVNPPTSPTPPGYSHAVMVSGGGVTVYVAGQVAIDEDGNLVGEGDFEAQTRQVFANLVSVLHSAGAGLADLVKLGIYVVDHDAAKLAVFRRIRDELMGDVDPPASTLLGVDGLALPGLLIEVDAIAFVAE